MNRNNLDYIFKTESQENIKIIEEKLIEIEKSNNIKSVIQEIYRCAHSLKGTISMIDSGNLKQITHNMENLLQSILENNIIPSTATIDILLETCDFLSAQINDYSRISNSSRYGTLTESLKKSIKNEEKKKFDTNKDNQAQYIDDNEVQTRKVNNFLIFQSGSQLFTVPMYYIEEVLNINVIKPIEYTENYILGAMNFHSTVMPVIDFNFRFGLFEKTQNPDHRILVFNYHETLLGVKIDKTIKMFSPGQLEFKRDKNSNLRTFCDGFYCIDNKKIFLLNVPTLFYYKKN
ncbi:chemotaxis protein CheW [bacterium]|nr:chemotaxis protein CheW [bacterium]